MHKPRLIESIKTIILVVLFLSTVLLLYFFWNNPGFKGLGFSKALNSSHFESTSNGLELVLPEEISVHFGGGLYTVLKQKDDFLWKECLNEFIQLFQKTTVHLEEISSVKYQEVMNLRSICYSFAYNIPFSSFCDQYGITKPTPYEQITFMKSISYSIGSPQSLFIEDEANGRYYRIAGEYEGLDYFAHIIGRSENLNYEPYYNLGTLVGGRNRTLTPIYIETGLKKIPYLAQSFNVNEQSIRTFAQLFFGSSLDFTRRVTESDGTVIYMYGYGQKVLRLNRDGSVEYKVEPGDNGNHGNPDLFAALNAAVSFINNHGSWDGGTHIGGFNTHQEKGKDSYLHPYLQQVMALEKNRIKGYRFLFGYKEGGKNIYYQKGAAIVAEVFGDQVVYYRRDVVIPDESLSHSDNPAGMEREAISIGNILAENYRIITEELKKAGYQIEGEEQEILFDSIVELVRYVDSGYLRKENELVPVWIMRIGEMYFYFDLYDGNSVKNEGIEEKV